MQYEHHVSISVSYSLLWKFYWNFFVKILHFFNLFIRQNLHSNYLYIFVLSWLSYGYQIRYKELKSVKMSFNESVITMLNHGGNKPYPGQWHLPKIENPNRNFRLNLSISGENLYKWLVFEKWFLITSQKFITVNSLFQNSNRNFILPNSSWTEKNIFL